MSIVFCSIAPHPPIVIPEVGRGRDQEVQKTQETMLELGRLLNDKDPEVLVLITPHGPVFSDAVAIYKLQRMKGDLSRFGTPEVTIEITNHPLSDMIIEEAQKKGISVVGLNEDLVNRLGLSEGLDHGAIVPLYFLKKAGVDIPVVIISMGMLPYLELYRLGTIISEAATRINCRTAVLASSDLSHRLTRDAPSGYHPDGERFDREVVRLVGDGDIEALITLDPEMVENAGECGLRPIIIALGTVDGLEIKSSVLSYQCPFGVGYMVASIEPVNNDLNRKLLSKISQSQREKIKKTRAEESAPVKLARQALEKYCRGELDKNTLDIPKTLTNKRAGAFVSIKKRGQLRGCMGTIEPVRDNLGYEIVENAISAGTRDSRFNPIDSEELDELEYSVDILGNPEPIKDLKELDPKKYGVIVQSGMRKGLLLPDLEGIDTVEEQLSIAKQKAGISPGEKVQIFRFKVERFK